MKQYLCFKNLPTPSRGVKEGDSPISPPPPPWKSCNLNLDMYEVWNTEKIVFLGNENNSNIIRLLGSSAIGVSRWRQSFTFEYIQEFGNSHCSNRNRGNSKPSQLFAFFFWMGTQMDILAKTFKQMQYHWRVFMRIFRMYTIYDTLFLIYFLSTSIFSDFVTKFCCDLFPFAG